MSDKSLFDAIVARDLSGVLEQMYAYRHPINCACPDCDLRARLSLESRSEPRERGYSNFDSETGIRKTGPID